MLFSSSCQGDLTVSSMSESVTAEDTAHTVVDSCSGTEVVSETCRTLKCKGYLACISEDLNIDSGWALMLWICDYRHYLHWILKTDAS